MAQPVALALEGELFLEFGVDVDGRVDHAQQLLKQGLVQRLAEGVPRVRGLNKIT